MERRDRCFVVVLFFVLASLGAISFVSCIAAEMNRAQNVDMKLDGKLCYLPESDAFKYGIAALVCITGVEVIGSAVICGSFCCGEKRNRGSSGISAGIKTLVLTFSWICFGGVVVLLGTATSMNREQPYGKGWLDGECYLVRKQVYVASAVLILFSAASTLSTAVLSVSGIQREKKQQRIHARAG